MKWVWASLALCAVAVGSLWIGTRFDMENPSMRHPERSDTSSSAAKPRGSRDPSSATPPQDDQGILLAVFGQAPEFMLTERSGRVFSKEGLAGKPWVADFIFTSCAGQCPLMSLEMRRLQGLFGPETGFRFVSFSVDPERDTPEVLASYADRYEAEKGRWFFLTGPKQEINRILKEFFLSPAEEPAMHSVRFILVDGEGQIRGYYDSSDSGSINQLIHDATILIKQTKVGQA